MIPEQLRRVGFRFIKLSWTLDNKGSRGKIPLEKDWQNTKNYSFDDPELQEWLDLGNNVGVATGYNMLFVPDIDSPEEYERIKDLLPETFTVKSGGRGLPHYYYFLRDVDEVPNRKVGKVDLRGLGGQVVGAGSILKNEAGDKIGEYTVLKDAPIADVSWNKIKEVFNITDERERVNIKEIMGGQEEGTRNSELFRMACLLVSQDFNKSDILAMLDNANKNNTKKISAVELTQIRDSAWRYKKAKKKEEKKEEATLQSNLRLDNYLKNVEEFYKTHPFFYDRNGLFWTWNFESFCYERTDDVDMMILIDKQLGFFGQTVAGGTKNNYLEAFKRVGRVNIPADLPKHWIQFKNKLFDLKTDIVLGANPDFFSTNPIPHNIGESSETTVIDKLFIEWVGEENKETLYEIIAYCCLPDYPIHTLFALIGSGRNGKSRFLELISRFVGRNNITSTDLDILIDRPFESTKLYKKLVCTMGETNFGTIKKTSLIKRLTGGDLIGFEFKNKNPFDDYNYAKILISSNSLPSSEDTSEGFYRRWLIIKFPNDFPEGKDILESVPLEEYDNLAKKIIEKLKNILERGNFTNQGTIEDRKKRYISASNPLKNFIEEHCVLDENYFVKYNDFYSAFAQHLTKNKQRIVSKREFGSVLAIEGFSIEKTSKRDKDGTITNGFWIYGLQLKQKKPSDTSDTSDTSFTLFSHIEDKHKHQSLQSLQSLSYLNGDENERQVSLRPSFEDLQNILLDKINYMWEIENILSFGFLESDLEQWIGEGLIFKVRDSHIKLV